jgi:S-adenosylmethionine decarboxylase
VPFVVKPLPRLKLQGFNNLTKSLSFNIYDVCYAASEDERRRYIEYIDEEYNADRLTQILTDVAEIIGANILNIARQDYDPQGASVTILISEQPVIDKADAKGVISEAVVAHLDKSHITVHTYPETHPDNGIATFRADIDVSTCGVISPLKALNYLIESLESDIVVMDYRVRGFTRDVKGRKHYIDHKINSIQDYLAKNVKARYEMLDVNVYQENLFHTKLHLKDFDLDKYLFEEKAKNLSFKERMKIERELLRLRQQERRAALERLASDPNADPEQRAAAGRLLGGLGERESAESVALTRGTGPVREAGNIADGILNEDGRESRFAAMYAEIDRLRQEDILSEEQAARAKAEINARHEEERLANTSQFFGDLAGLANSSNRTLAGIGRAAAIAQATIDGYLAVQKALASAPPPMNFALAAAAGAAAAANVAAIAGVGFAGGGYVDGPGTETSDSIPARLSRGEFVIRADQTKKHRSLLEAINRGSLPGFAKGGIVSPVWASEAAGETMVPAAQLTGRVAQ